MRNDSSRILNDTSCGSMISSNGITPPRQQGASNNTGKSFTTPISRKNTAAADKQEHESPFVLNYDVDSTADDTIPLGSCGKSTMTATKRNESSLSFTIVWSPLPPITWLIPFIGHTGICDSSGTASDFRGPYYVGDDGRMAFGPPTRFLKIDIESCNVSPDQWDASIQEANDVYRGRMHNICCDNCHSHVAYALNQSHISAYGIHKWDMVKIATIMFFRGSFLTWTAVLQQFLPCTIVVGIIIFFINI
jgi:transmembrane protein 222